MLNRPTDNPDPERKGESGEVSYAFPTRSRCPESEGGCGSLDTHAVRTAGRHQYRKCQQCGHCFKVIGWKV